MLLSWLFTADILLRSKILRCLADVTGVGFPLNIFQLQLFIARTCQTKHVSAGTLNSWFVFETKRIYCESKFYRVLPLFSIVRVPIGTFMNILSSPELLL